MDLKKTYFNDVFLINSNRHSDERGFFQRLFCLDILASHMCEISQINRSFNKQAGILRGMHYQVGTSAETKMVWCLTGSVFDVVVDIRPNSPSKYKHFSVTLSSGKDQGIIIPKGFAHGFQVLEPNTTLLYFHDEKYNPDLERRLNPLDPKLKITWPHEVTSISDKDKHADYL